MKYSKWASYSRWFRKIIYLKFPRIIKYRPITHFKSHVFSFWLCFQKWLNHKSTHYLYHFLDAGKTMHIITFLYSPESGMMISSMTWIMPLVPTTSLATICIPETKSLPSSGLLSRSKMSPSILMVIKRVWMAAEHTQCFNRWCLRTSIKSRTVRPNKPLQKKCLWYVGGQDLWFPTIQLASEVMPYLVTNLQTQK